jgi:penicillin-binding protein 1C
MSIDPSEETGHNTEQIRRFRRLIDSGEDESITSEQSAQTTHSPSLMSTSDDSSLVKNQAAKPFVRQTATLSLVQGNKNSSKTASPELHAPTSRQAGSARVQRAYQQSNGRQALKTPAKPRRKLKINWGTIFGVLLRMAILGTIGLVFLVIAAGSFMLYEYYKIAATLPNVDDLRQRASQFETTRIFDRNGNMLYEILDPNAGRRTYVTLDKISPYLIAATIATEDQNYYSHPGFDWLAIVRAFWQNWQEGETVSGASTITQQVARNLLLEPEERGQRTYLRKVREALLAAEITRRYSKDEILEVYLNENYYGSLAYGVEAAAQTYFGIPASQLSLAQASMLAGLPQAPAVYDIYNNLPASRQRQQQVLTLMYEMSREKNCIYVSNNPERICVDADTAIKAYVELENYPFRQADVQIRYPHWVNYVRSLLETKYDPQDIYRSGFSVYTTLDPGLQESAEKIVRVQVDALEENNAQSGALVAIRPSTGEILAMVGSADFYNEEIDGQVNMAVSQTRQPGSSIKPLTYLAALEKGWTASTLIWDVPSEFPPSGIPTDPSPPYKPVNYDERFHGPVTLRSALANSYNVPAVKTLQAVGIYDDPNTPQSDGLIGTAQRLGITSLTRNDYGLSLTLGGGEVSLMELTGAYAVLANSGRLVPPVAITRIVDHKGEVVFDHQTPAGNQVIRSEHAYILSSILSDNEARVPMFGSNSVLALPFTAAAKTGTTNDFRDNWTLGYTPDVAVGVWVGNPDYTPMWNTTGLTGAAPIWAEFMVEAVQQLTGGNPTPFSRPAGIIDRIVCSVSGTEPSQWCPSQRSEIFAAEQPPLNKDQDLWARMLLDTWTGLRASPACSEFTDEEFVLNVTDTWAIGWIRNDPSGKVWATELGFQEPIRFAPSRECRADDPRPFISFSSPTEGQTITINPLEVFARVDASADFRDYSLDYGLGNEPVEWTRLVESNQPSSQPSKIYSWYLDEIPAGVVTLRLRMRSIRDTMAVLRLHVNLQLSTPTPTLTATPTDTPSPTPTTMYSNTPVPSLTSAPSQTPAPSNTPTPTATEMNPVTSTPTQVPLPSDTPGPTPTGQNNPASQPTSENSTGQLGNRWSIALLTVLISFYKRRNCDVE